MRSKRLVALSLTLGALAFGPGCVSYNLYAEEQERARRMSKVIEDQEGELARLRAEHAGCPGVLVGLRSERESLAARNGALEAALRTSQDAMHHLSGKLAELRSGMKSDFAEIVGVEATSRGIALDGDVFFDSGKITLKEAGKKALAEVARVLKSQKYGDYDVVIEGHTDSDPIVKSKWDDNWVLGFERARAVMLFLEKEGVVASRVALASYGPHRPRDAKVKARNRRVEIVPIERR